MGETTVYIIDSTMASKCKSKIQETFLRQLPAAGESDIVAVQVGNDLLHRLDILRVFLIVYLVAFGELLVGSLINLIRIVDEWGHTAGCKHFICQSINYEESTRMIYLPSILQGYHNQHSPIPNLKITY